MISTLDTPTLDTPLVTRVPANAVAASAGARAGAVAGAAAQQRRLRDDALPEHFAYRDEGCDLFASCLTCPLPRCRYDEPGGARTMLNRYRDDEIRRLFFDAGVPVDELSMRYRISRRTVFRVIRQARPNAEVCG